MKGLLLLLLLPVLCCGFLCNGSLPLCPLMHHCEHETVSAHAHAAPLDACGHEHGEQLDEQHRLTALTFVPNSEVKHLKPLTNPAAAAGACELPAPRRLVLAALPREVWHTAARPRYLGHLRPFRC